MGRPETDDINDFIVITTGDRNSCVKLIKKLPLFVSSFSKEFSSQEKAKMYNSEHVDQNVKLFEAMVNDVKEIFVPKLGNYILLSSLD